MKFVLSTLIGIASAAFVTAASAHVVAVTTSIPAVKVLNDVDLKEALGSAVDDALSHPIGFIPTAVILEDVRRVGNRIYLVLLFVDKDGEDLLKQLEADDTDPTTEPLTVPDGNDEVRTL